MVDVVSKSIPPHVFHSRIRSLENCPRAIALNLEKPVDLCESVEDAEKSALGEVGKVVRVSIH